MRFDLAALPDQATWVFTGDSITHGVYHTHGMRSWVELVHERIRWELDRIRDIVVNTGVSGWTAGQVVADYVHLVQRFRPDVVSLSLGTNDALAGPAGLTPFAERLRELADRASHDGAVSPHRGWMTTPTRTPWDTSRWPRPRWSSWG